MCRASGKIANYDAWAHSATEPREQERGTWRGQDLAGTGPGGERQDVY